MHEQGTLSSPARGSGHERSRRAFPFEHPRWFLALAAVVWLGVYRSLSPASEWLTGRLPLEPGSHLRDALAFFLYDTPKVLLLLTGVVFVMGMVNSYFTPERTRALLAGRGGGRQGGALGQRAVARAHRGVARVTRLGILGAVAAAIVAVLVLRPRPVEAPASPAQAVTSGRPKLLDLGATTCVPCKAMVPVLAGLEADYAGALDVEFIDLWKDREAGERWRVAVMPTQIFLGADGRELYRHEGFFSRDAILAQWAKLGVELRPAQ